MKFVAVMCGVMAGTALLTSCGPESILDQPPTPVQPGAAMPFTPVKQPLDLTSFEKTPCQILTKDQVAAVVADPPSDVRPTLGDNSAAVGCNWISRSGPLVIISEPLAGPVSLAELAASRPTSTHNLEPWSEVSLDGYPTVVYHQGSGPDNCDVAVGVSDTKMLHFSYGGDSTPSRYWDKDRCGGVLKTAEFVLDNLRRT